MKNGLIVGLLLALAVPIAWAGEHPSGSEHPTGQEHPSGGKTHKKKKKKSKKSWVKHAATMKAFVHAVEGHVGMKSADEGSFTVYDKTLDKTWELKLVRIHKNRIARLGENKFFACADFKTAAKGEETKIDLDFFVTREGEDWNVDEVLVHKINGKPRYTYNAKNERVPVGDKKNRGKKKKKGHEHPAGDEHPAGNEHPH